VSPTFSSLRNRNFRLFVGGQVVSNTGTWMQRVAQDWLVLQLSGGSGTALGITTALQFLPLLLFSLWGGVLADRLPKRTVLVITQAVMGLQALVLGLLVVTHQAELWQVYVLAFLLGSVTALDNPTRQSFVPEMVGTRDLPNAVALGSATFNLGRVLGPAAAGLLIAAFSTGPVFLINAASYLAVIVSLLLMRTADLRPTARPARGPGALRAGLRYVRHHPDLRLVIALIAVVGTFGLNFQITIALMATQEFGKGARAYGLLGTAFAIGSLTGALMSARRAGRTASKPSLRRVILLAGGFAVMEIAAGLSPSYPVFFVALIPTGVLALNFVTSANANLQLTAEPAMRGRVMALYTLVFFGGSPVGAPFIGWLAQTAGARWSLLGGGAVTLLGAVIVLLVHRARGAEPGEPPSRGRPVVPVDEIPAA
jgi:MFS family permease